MPNPKLLYIGNKLATQGATVSTIDSLSTQLESEGYTVYLASSKRNKFLRLLDMMWAVFRYRRKVSCVLIDTYSTQNFYYAVGVANLCRLLKVPYTPILHGGNLPERLRRNKRLCWKLFNGAKINVSPSTYLMEEFKKEGYNNLIEIPNNIVLENYPFRLRSEPKPKLLWVRSFAEIYNPTLALKVVDLLQKSDYQVSLCMVGPDKDGSLERCKKIATEASLPVKFTGRLSKSEWIDLSTNYDIFINTTNFDNTPVSVIEAMALGLPVVTTNVGGIPYLLENKSDALLVRPKDADAMCQSVVSLIEAPQKAVLLAKNARKKVEKFEWEEVKHLWFKILKA
ncbi:MAG: glycosyltransferase [Flavobacterium sp.]|nr:MAG: glycosyltransferase [Flavobacterium sp.]